jgi:hypothetical protein
VTTGSVGGAFPGDFNTPQSYRAWSGTDGKYEPYAGGTRDKWNNFSLTACARLCTDKDFQLTSKGDVGFGLPVPYLRNYSLSSGALLLSPVSISAKEQIQLLNKLLAKIKSHDFNLGVNLGQLKQTTGLLSSNLGHLGRSLWSLRKGDIAGAARELGIRKTPKSLKSDSVSGRWLELQYGWLPLVSDSFEAMKAFEAISSGPRSARFVVTRSKPMSQNVTAAPTHYSAMMRGTGGRRLQYEMYEEMSVQRQLGLLDPLSIAWELTPWSFVIDWFVPIGNYLSALNQIPSLKGRWLVTDFTRYPKQPIQYEWLLSQYGGTHPAYGQTRALDLPDCVQSYTKIDRTFSGSPPPVPSPRFDLRGAITTRRFFNALGLAHQRAFGPLDRHSNAIAAASRVRKRYKKRRKPKLRSTPSERPWYYDT